MVEIQLMENDAPYTIFDGMRNLIKINLMVIIRYIL